MGEKVTYNNLNIILENECRNPNLEIWCPKESCEFEDLDIDKNAIMIKRNVQNYDNGKSANISIKLQYISSMVENVSQETIVSARKTMRLKKDLSVPKQPFSYN